MSSGVQKPFFQNHLLGPFPFWRFGTACAYLILNIRRKTRTIHEFQYLKLVSKSHFLWIQSFLNNFVYKSRILVNKWIDKFAIFYEFTIFVEIAWLKISMNLQFSRFHINQTILIIHKFLWIHNIPWFSKIHESKKVAKKYPGSTFHFNFSQFTTFYEFTNFTNS